MLKKISLNTLLLKPKPVLIIGKEVTIFEDNNFILINLNQTHYKLLKSLYTDACVKKILSNKIRTSSEALQIHLTHLIKQHSLNKLGVYVIYDKQKQKRIGLVNFNFKGKTNTIIELSLMIRSPFRRHGLSSKICITACKLAYKHNLTHLNAVISKENIAAHKMLCNSGFLSTGTIYNYQNKDRCVLTFFKDLTVLQ